ncbi:MAG: POTRA domain-containing protein [Planctomycetota bacterium]
MKTIYFFLLFVGSLHFAQIIDSVEIQGQKNVSEQLIRHLLLSKPRTSFDLELCNQDLKLLYSFGFFQQISFSQEIDAPEVKLQIQLEEHPLLLEMDIQGNTHLSSTVLLSHLLLRKGAFLAPYKVIQAVQTLIRIYREQGFWFIQVRCNSEASEAGMLLHFLIDEGPLVKVEKINLEGLQNFSAEEILPYLLTPPRGSFWKTEVLSSLKLETDRLAIIHFYRASGFLDVRVSSAQLKQESIDPIDSSQVMLPTFHIQEGNRYRIDTIAFSGNTYLSESILREKISLFPGQVLTQKEISRALRLIYELYQKSPYKYFQVNHELIFQEDFSDPRTQLIFFFIEE